jgi:hypothetical protein
MRRALVATCSLLFPITAVVAGCLDPTNDFNDWLSRSADARAGTSVVSDASFDAMLSSSFDQTYVMACVPQLAPDDPTKALLFNAHLVFTLSGGPGNGTLDVTQTALVAHATDTTMTTGMPVSVMGTPVMGGMAAVNSGAITIPGNADTITSNPIVFTSSTLYFSIASPTQLCAGLAGMVTMPIPLMLDKTKNICRFKVPMGTAVPMFTADEFLSCP